MKIAIDARWIFREISGIGAYTRELVRNLALLDHKNEYLILFHDPVVSSQVLSDTCLDNAGNFHCKLLPYDVFSPASQLLLPRFLRKNNVDVFHSTNYMIPLFAFPADRKGRISCVTTIHDVIPMIFPHHAPKSKKARLYPLYRRIMIEVGRRSDVIITDSLASKEDVIRHLHIKESRHNNVKTVYCGVSERFQPRQKATRDGPRTVLYVGRTDPYKNLVTLIRAFAAAREACPFPLALTIAGPRDNRYPEPSSVAEKLRVSDAVQWTGYLSDSDLVQIYRNADILVHPSRYEGFGLQVIEAMACGIPVICSNAGALPEVTGDAAILLAPDDVQGFAENIRKILVDSKFACELSEKGIKRAAEFTWSRTAGETLAIYRELMNADRD